MLRRITIIFAIVIGCGFLIAPVASAQLAGQRRAVANQAADTALPAWKAVVLGLVEGVTEYLPISSTGHLHVTERLLDVGSDSATKDSADTYAITIQAGAIFAVLVLYRRRIIEIVRGVLGRSATGRRVFVALTVAFLPAALTGAIFGDLIKDQLLAAGPIVGAWILGALAIWILVPRLGTSASRSLDSISCRQAAIIGVAQVLALWPGTSRSLVTIIAALAVGLSLSAAIEFSFILGLLTLSAATIYDGASNGSELVSTFGIATPVLGLLVAFGSAVFAVKWMVRYIESRGLAIFATYRLLAAGVTLLLIATNTI